MEGFNALLRGQNKKVFCFVSIAASHAMSGVERVFFFFHFIFLLQL
jgi:hypothetical protein